MHLVSPRAIMGNGWWDKQRQKAYASTDYHCAACEVHKTQALYKQHLEAHEVYEMDYPMGRMIFQEIVPLCHACHNYIHCGRMQAMVDQGKMFEGKMKAIKERGDRLLEMAGLEHPPPPARIAKWSRWRLEFNGKTYPPVLRSPEAWMDHFVPGWKSNSNMIQMFSVKDTIITDFDSD